MSETLQIRGVVGQIRWAYYVAAAVHGYTVVVNKKTGAGTLRATIVSSDAFRLSQHGLVFAATHKGGEWRWTIDTLQISGGTVTGTLSRFKE